MREENPSKTIRDGNFFTTEREKARCREQRVERRGRRRRKGREGREKLDT
jgi:hypothetical protein